MLASLASNAILAKARAMYGKRLSLEDYRELLRAKTVHEVASYLKNNTVYGKTLSAINETDVHRGQLEAALRMSIMQDFAALCRYEISVGEEFSKYLIIRSEIEQILHALMLLSAGRSQEYLFYLPAYLAQNSKVNLALLSHVKSYEDVLSALNGTDYRGILETFAPGKNGDGAGAPMNYAAIENALYTYLYRFIFDMIATHHNKSTARELREIFDNYIDLLNFTRILRLRVLYHARPDFIRSSLLPFGSLSEKTLAALLAAEDEKSLYALMGKTKVGRRFLQRDYAYIEEIPQVVKYLSCRKDIHFSSHPSVVMLSYIFITEVEMMDVINIIEGIRYGLPPGEIEKLLTIVNFKEKGGRSHGSR